MNNLNEVKEQPELGERVSPNSPVLKAEIVHAIQEEMALSLSGIIFHRTVLGSNGPPENACLQICANLMVDYLGWDSTRIQQEIDMAVAM